ncbi:flavodoxin family protein [Hymenobacter nivis]|uniref:Flavodoxin-like domain-containing protein n=1 Tax=Hymenobacter nivis TaxID=1850093 RepID=A0A2Z3GM10_9BACT|nr:flavodoxin [Hymenobacter nivis]AWM32236.1 hypothetical protein DDQ68_05165 [Hymenobacter nivis]
MNFRSQNWPWAALAGVGMLALAAVITRPNHARANAHHLPANPHTDGDGRTLVAYYSRSGFTRLMATEIARQHKARLVELVDPSYQGALGYVWAILNSHRRTATITPATLDVSAYDTIYIGAPVWLGTSAPEAWAFLHNIELAGKKVVLFNTLSGKFSQRYVEQFAALVQQRGGTFGGHLYVLSDKQTPEQFVAAVREKLS